MSWLAVAFRAEKKGFCLLAKGMGMSGCFLLTIGEGQQKDHLRALLEGPQACLQILLVLPANLAAV